MLQFGTAVLIGILLAKSGLPTGMISVYETLIFIGSLCCFFWIVAGQNTLLQLFPTLGEVQKQRALFNVFLLFTIVAGATGGLLFLTKNIIAQRLTNFAELPYLDWLALFLVFNSPTFLLQIFYLLLKRYRAIVVFGIVSFSLQIMVVVLPVFLGYTLRETMVGLVAWAALKFAWCVFELVRFGKWQLDLKFWRLYLPLVLPLLLFSFIGKGSEYISGLLVTTLFEDEKAFAVFRYGAREFPLGVLMLGALATSLIAETSENLDAGLARIKETTRKLSHWLFPLSMLSMLASPLLFPIIFNPDFKDSARIFNIFTLMLSSRVLLTQVVQMSRRKNYFLSLSAFVEVALLGILGWWLGGLFGPEGVAFGAVIAYLLGKILGVWYNWQVLKISLWHYLDWKTYAVYNVLLVLCFLVSRQL